MTLAAEHTEEQIIREHSTPALIQEIEALYEVAKAEEWESIKTFEDAFREVSDRADTCKSWKSLLTPARKVHIALGEYVEMTQHEIETTVCSRGKPWAFKLNGKAYQLA